MAVVKPFRALRYDEALAGPLEASRRAPVRRHLGRAARRSCGSGARTTSSTSPCPTPRKMRHATWRTGARTASWSRSRRPSGRSSRTTSARTASPVRASGSSPRSRSSRTRPERCCRTSAPMPARRRPASACCARRASSWSRSSCSTTAPPGGAARTRAGPRGRRGEALADRRSHGRPLLRRQAAPDRRRSPPLRDRRRLQRGGGIPGERADARRPRLDGGSRARDLPHAPALRRAEAPRRRAERRRVECRDHARRVT